jgi:hypothetical protein
VGFVDQLRYGSSAEKTDAIAVRAGFGRLLLIVPTGEVEEISPREERMLLRRSPRPSATKNARELDRRLRLLGPQASEGSSEKGGEGHGRSDSRRDRSRRRPVPAAGAAGSPETGRR